MLYLSSANCYFIAMTSRLKPFLQVIENAEFNSDAESSDEEQPVGAGQVGRQFNSAPTRFVHCTSLDWV